VKLNHYPRLFFLVFPESDNPPDTDVLAQEIVEDLEAALLITAFDSLQFLFTLVLIVRRAVGILRRIRAS
jgi:hypothetical protein